MHQCVPLSGFGFRRGGYECVCQPGHRLPYMQHGPFQGVDIESATEEEYRAGFDCLPVGWREVVPEETGLKERPERYRRSVGGQQQESWTSKSAFVAVVTAVMLMPERGSTFACELIPLTNV